MFKDALNKHEEYRQRCFAESGGYSSYDAEIGKKISQINWLIYKAQALNAKVVGSKSSESNGYLEAITELEIVTETFYYFVGRLVEIFKHHPSFSKLSRSNAEKVRHQLLQHPEKEKDREKAFVSFEFGAKEGPKIKSYTGPKGSLEDNGLFENAKEFNSKLVDVFIKEANKA